MRKRSGRGEAALGPVNHALIGWSLPALPPQLVVSPLHRPHQPQQDAGPHLQPRCGLQPARCPCGGENENEGPAGTAVWRPARRSPRRHQRQHWGRGGAAQPRVELSTPPPTIRRLSPPPPTCLQARRSAVAVQASTRPLWQPGTTPPAHLDGSMPGDFGFGEQAARRARRTLNLTRRRDG